MKQETQLESLSMEDLEQTHGGIVPLIVGVAAGYAFMMGVASKVEQK